MLALALSEFMIELKDGTIRNVGGPTKSASAKLFDVTSAEARPFGDDRVKFVFADDDGNEVQAACFADEVRAILDDADEIAASVEGLSDRSTQETDGSSSSGNGEVL